MCQQVGAHCKYYVGGWCHGRIRADELRLRQSGNHGLAKAVALEGARYNITANVVLVGVAETGAPLADDVRQKLERGYSPVASLSRRRLPMPWTIWYQTRLDI